MLPDWEALIDQGVLRVGLPTVDLVSKDNGVSKPFGLKQAHQAS